MTASQTYPRSRVRTPGFQSGSCPPRGATSVSRGSGNSVGSKGAKDTAPSRGAEPTPPGGSRVNQRTEVAARQHLSCSAQSRAWASRGQPPGAGWAPPFPCDPGGSRMSLQGLTCTVRK